MDIKPSNLTIIENILKYKFDNCLEYNKLSENDRVEVSMHLASIIFGQQSSFWRAKMVETSIAIEMNLAQLLSAYFVSEKDKKFSILNSMIFDRMNLSTKIKHVTELLKRHHLEVYTKYKANIVNIGKLITFRNELTHSLLSVTSDDFSKYLIHVNRVLSENKRIEELEYFYISFYEKDTFKTKKILFSEIIKSIDELYKENEIIMKIKTEIINH